MTTMDREGWQQHKPHWRHESGATVEAYGKNPARPVHTDARCRVFFFRIRDADGEFPATRFLTLSRAMMVAEERNETCPS